MSEEITERYQVNHYDDNGVPVFVVTVHRDLLEDETKRTALTAYVEKIVQLSCEDLGFNEDQAVSLIYHPKEDDEKNALEYPY